MSDRHNAKIIFLGNSKEKSICYDIERLVKNKVINVCGETSIKKLTGIISNCNLIITNDGGPLHIAVGLGVKTVSIFGPVNEIVYGPYPEDKEHIVISRKDLKCRPCYKKFKYTKCENRQCLDLITVSEVTEAAEKLIKK